MKNKPKQLISLFLIALATSITAPTLLPSLTQPALAQNQSDREAEADRLFNQGIQQAQTSQYREAIQSWQKALKIYREMGNRNGVANSLMGLGIVYRNLGEYPKAIEYYQQSLAIFTEIGDRNGVANSLNNLGIVYYSLGEYPKALEYYQQPLAIFTEIGDRNGEAKSLGNLGLVYRNLGEYPKAIEYHQQSLAIFTEIGDRNGEGITFSNLGYLYEQQGQPELAIILFKQSVIVREGIRGDLRVLDRALQESYTETVAGTYRSLADLLLSQDRIYEAQQVLELLKLQEIQDFTPSRRARGELPKVIILPQEKAIIDIYLKLVTFGAEIAQCEQTNCSNLSDMRDQLDTLTGEYDQVDNET